MGLFSALIKDGHTFAAWAEKELTKLYGEAPKLEQIADTVLSYAGPMLQTLVTAEAGSAAGSVVSGVVKQAQADLTVASGLIYDIGPAPSVASFLKGVQSDLGGLLTAGHIKNPASVATVNKVVGEVGALVNAFPASAAPAPAAPAKAA